MSMSLESHTIWGGGGKTRRSCHYSWSTWERSTFQTLRRYDLLITKWFMLRNVLTQWLCPLDWNLKWKWFWQVSYSWWASLEGRHASANVSEIAGEGQMIVTECVAGEMFLSVSVTASCFHFGSGEQMKGSVVKRDDTWRSRPYTPICPYNITLRFGIRLKTELANLESRAKPWPDVFPVLQCYYWIVQYVHAPRILPLCKLLFVHVN